MSDKVFTKISTVSYISLARATNSSLRSAGHITVSKGIDRGDLEFGPMDVQIGVLGPQHGDGCVLSRTGQPAIIARKIL